MQSMRVCGNGKYLETEIGRIEEAYGETINVCSRHDIGGRGDLNLGQWMHQPGAGRSKRKARVPCTFGKGHLRQINASLGPLDFQSHESTLQMGII